MVDTVPVPDSEPNQEQTALLQSLRRKEGNWVQWGQTCQTLQKAGYTPQRIFEETGFEPIQQNQVIVGAQVYASIVAAGASAATQAYFEQRGSDVLYELRTLTQAERAALAELAFESKLNLDETHEAAKAMKDFSRLGRLPEGYTHHPGDAIAYQAWKLARQQADLQERSRLIAKGLRFAHSETARKQVEQLLTDFTVISTVAAPRLPLYRLDDTEQLPRVLPVVGKLPLAKADLQAVPFVEEVAPFNLVKFSGMGAWAPVPGWQVVLSATDPVAILVDSDKLPTPLPGDPEEVLVVVDRAQREWAGDRYFLTVTEQTEQLTIEWFEQTPKQPILGQVILLLRPKKILDEGYTQEMPSEARDALLKWQYEE
jgi:hypothetical protein